LKVTVDLIFEHSRRLRGISVAAGMCEAPLGTHSGDSIRVPVALAGTVGLRGTIGLVSSRGIEPVSPDLDTVGR